MINLSGISSGIAALSSLDFYKSGQSLGKWVATPADQIYAASVYIDDPNQTLTVSENGPLQCIAALCTSSFTRQVVLQCSVAVWVEFYRT